MITRPSGFDTSLGPIDNGVPMEVTLAVVADGASRDETGKLNIYGIFDQVYSDKFPFQYPLMFLAVRFSANPSEFGRRKEIEVSLVDPDGRVLGGGKAKGDVPKPEGGTRANVEILLRMENVPFPKPGPYHFSVLIGGEEKARIPVDVVVRKSEKKRRK